MEELQVTLEDGSLKTIKCVYYYSNNNYYLIYTNLLIDENGYVVLHLSKITRQLLQDNSTQLVGVKIDVEDEWKQVQSDIGKIVEDKKNKKNDAVYYLESKNLENLKIMGSRIFRLRPDIIKEAFDIDAGISKEQEEPLPVQTDAEFMDYKTKYLDSLSKIKELEIEVNGYKQKISSIKNLLQ